MLLPILLALGGAGAVAAAALAAWGASRARGRTVRVHLTGYWPFSATLGERKMEGGPEGAASWNGKRVVDPQTGKRVRLHTLEQHLADPQAHPFVALSGDPEVWPFGERLTISPWPGAVFRVVDTGSHFTDSPLVKGARKVRRVPGEEPLDVCVDSSATLVPKKGATATDHAGDNWEGGRAVNLDMLRDEVVAGEGGGRDLDVLGTDREGE